jgi:hypothetical protein
MSEIKSIVIQEHLPFFVTGPGESDVLFTAVTIALILVVLGFGALYFTIQAIPDRLATGVGKAQMQVVGILGLISLITMNNAYWVAALLLAAIRIPDFVTPFKSIARSQKRMSITNENQQAVMPPAEVQQEAPVEEKSDEKEEQDSA